MSWDLNAAEAKAHYLTETDLWRYTQQFFWHASHTTTYKHVLMKALLQCVPEISAEGKLTFWQIAKHVTTIYWNLVITHQLRQIHSTTKRSGVETALLAFQQQHKIPSEWTFEKLPQAHQQQLITAVNRTFKQYVYGSFYSSFEGTIYSFSKKEEWLQLAPPYIVFFEKYRRIVIQTTNYQLALFLEKVNDAATMQHILTKLEFVAVRQSLESFRQLLVAQRQPQCFYCHKALHKMHVDHFIPWSYMQNDVLWNFVLACPTCNTSKNNKLAVPHYLEQLIERNDRWQHQQIFTHYDEQRLPQLYDFAIFNGFPNEWQPTQRM